MFRSIAFHHGFGGRMPMLPGSAALLQAMKQDEKFHLSSAENFRSAGL